MRCWTFWSTRTLTREDEKGAADARAGGSPSRRPSVRARAQVICAKWMGDGALKLPEVRSGRVAYGGQDRGGDRAEAPVTRARGDVSAFPPASPSTDDRPPEDGVGDPSFST